jgi:hypothetical protein
MDPRVRDFKLAPKVRLVSLPRLPVDARRGVLLGSRNASSSASTVTRRPIAVKPFVFLSHAVRHTRSRSWDAPAPLGVLSYRLCPGFLSVAALGSTTDRSGAPIGK